MSREYKSVAFSFSRERRKAMSRKTVLNISIGLITAITKGAPMKIVAGNFTKALYDLITGPKYKKVEDLKGTTMGVINLESGSTVLLQKILLAHGLKYPDDYDILTIGGTPARYAA